MACSTNNEYQPSYSKGMDSLAHERLNEEITVLKSVILEEKWLFQRLQTSRHQHCFKTKFVTIKPTILPLHMTISIIQISPFY